MKSIKVGRNHYTDKGWMHRRTDADYELLYSKGNWCLSSSDNILLVTLRQGPMTAFDIVRYVSASQKTILVNDPEDQNNPLYLAYHPAHHPMPNARVRMRFHSRCRWFASDKGKKWLEEQVERSLATPDSEKPIVQTLMAPASMESYGL